MHRKMNRDSWDTRVAGARETRLRSKSVCNGEGERKAEQRTERERERGGQMERKEGDGEKKGKWKRENRVEGKRKSETARERDVRVTGRAARRVASRRLASPRVTQSSGYGSEEVRLERRQSVLNCLSTRQPLRVRAVYRITPGLTTRRAVSLPRLYVIRFFCHLSLSLLSTDRIGRTQ